jgi:hypothetical protein
MSEYSIGIEDHYAWANLVSVTTSGPREILLDKRRVELLDQQHLRARIRRAIETQETTAQGRA